MPTNNRRADRHFRGMANDNPTSKRQPRPVARRTSTRTAAIAAHLKEF